MNKFLEENNIRTFDFELSDSDAEKIGYRGGTLQEEDERLKVWQHYVDKLVYRA